VSAAADPDRGGAELPGAPDPDHFTQSRRRFQRHDCPYRCGARPDGARGTPDTVASASRSPDVVAALRAQGIEPSSSRPQEFAAFVQDQLELHRQLVKDVDLKISE
jgi:hypothetical protein